MKSEPPPYPRPVPHIDCNEDILLPGARVYVSNDDGADGTVEELAKQRGAKRRRIEEHAQSYLRGDGLFILSAGLKGPFDGTWRNPWSRGRKKRKFQHEVKNKPSGNVDIIKESRHIKQCSTQTQDGAPTTALRASTPLNNPFQQPLLPSDPPKSNEKVENWLRRSSVLPQEESFAAPASPTPKAKPSHIDSAKTRNWTPTKQRITVTSQDVGAPIHQPNFRVEESFETLVRGESLVAQPETAHSRLQNALHAESIVFVPELSMLQNPHMNIYSPTACKDRAEEEIARTTRKHVESKDLESLTNSRGPLYGELVNAIGVATTTNESDASKLVTPPVSDQEQRDKYIYHKIRTTREKSQVVKSVPHDDQQQSNKVSFLGNRNEVKDGEQVNLPEVVSPEVKLEKPEALLDAEISGGEVHTDTIQRQGDDSEDQDIATSRPPILSTAATDLTSTNMPPSAQPKPELQTLTSLALSSIELLGPVPITSEMLRSVNASEVEDHHLDVPDDSGAASPSKQFQKSGLLIEAAVHGPNEVQQNVAGQNESSFSKLEMVSALETLQPSISDPKRIDTEQPSIPKSSLPTSLQHITSTSPQPAKRQRVAKKPKKASFVAESSSMSSTNGSIKSALKVQKVGASPKSGSVTSKRLRSPPPSFSHPEVDMETSAEDEISSHGSPLQALHSPLLNNTPRPRNSARKGILKNTNVPSPSAAALASVALSSRLATNAPLASGQNKLSAVADDDGFDLAGAIDDLGSFLSTWTDEKDGLQVA